MKQEIKLGDKVEVLHGAYKGKTGTIVGMMVLDQDYADPYYEVNMDCEVEERHKCHKSLIKPNNIIGGVIASDIKLISHYGGFKVGGKVRICSKASDLYGQVVTVKELCPDGVGFDGDDGSFFWFHYSLVEPYAEPTEQTESEEDCVIHKMEAELDELRKAHYDIMNWPRYEADLAHDLAVQMVKGNRNSYDKIGEMAVRIAKSVVKNLKENQI